MNRTFVAAVRLVQGFRAAFAPASMLLYPAAAGAADADQLARLSLPDPTPTTAPTAVLYDAARQRIYLLEAVPAHGPITPARRQQLAAWAQACPAAQVYVTAFPTMAVFQAHSAPIAWETNVWLADAPQHLIHFNGDRFLGPR